MFSSLILPGGDELLLVYEAKTLSGAFMTSHITSALRPEVHAKSRAVAVPWSALEPLGTPQNYQTLQSNGFEGLGRICKLCELLETHAVF